jgi:hypothetical protein
MLSLLLALHFSAEVDAQMPGGYAPASGWKPEKPAEPERKATMKISNNQHSRVRSDENQALLKAEEPLMEQCQFRLHKFCNMTSDKINCLNCADVHRRSWLTNGCDQQDSARYCAHRFAFSSHGATKSWSRYAKNIRKKERARKKLKQTNKARGKAPTNAMAMDNHTTDNSAHKSLTSKITPQCFPAMEHSCGHTLYKHDRSLCRLCAFRQHTNLLAAGCNIQKIDKICTAKSAPAQLKKQETRLRTSPVSLKKTNL